MAVVAEREHRPAVTRRRQEPVQHDGHRSHHGDCRPISSTLTRNVVPGRQKPSGSVGFSSVQFVDVRPRRLEAAAMTDNERYASPVDTEQHGEYRITQTADDPRPLYRFEGRISDRRVDAVRRRGRSLPHLLGVVLPVGPAGHDRPRARRAARTSSRCPTSTASATPGAGRSGSPTGRTR